ncbi:HlyD family efflux transporter periplasmic adaptor subunit [Paracoccus sp. R12_1]|jgi:RND family efflux transporter MFP subunit|uniref:efflux RND transporter periplasmic adaptor subunit n=1 Tax=unclassified Paracoccus (in: a-proteobacteria) TaxID=2688777 RepID=UPI001AD9F018|nr:MULTISPECIES: HlyD family efflux transporter periplasmic adaptor subunit [unclassified Paracoccus (in: a-proteobacteria)]MBO9453595.1 HlyD family efflux transporter periplasmic adaptor subunit [Paracoccus sp. R12_2]MBO9486981.1 HlyD family efflux transporter periplasmic adaptor subunit [Paracoccus sp. R12_1]
MRFLFRSLSGLFITFLTFGLLFVAGFQLFQAMSSRGSGGMAREGQEQVFTARLLTVAPGVVQPVMQVFGTVESRRRLQLRSGAAGQIVYLDPAMQEGGQVRQGQLLVRVDPSAAQAALDNQLAARDDAQASLADAERNVQVATDDLAAAERQTELRRAALTRQESLADRGLGTSADRETAELAVSTAEQAVIAGRSALAAAESAVTAAQNALRRAEIDLSEARRELADTEIRAGFAGRVTSVTAVEGGLVSLNEQLAEIIDPASLEVQVPLSLDQYARLLTENGRLQDLPATVVLDGSAGRLTSRARLDRAAASVAEGSAGRIVYARILSDSDVLRPGDFVSVEISEPQIANAALIPAAAVGTDGSVLVADAEGRLTAMPVSVLRRQADDVIVEVPAALAGARIVAERAPQLGTGIRVRDAAAPVPAQDQRALNTQGQGNG